MKVWFLKSYLSNTRIKFQKKLWAQKPARIIQPGGSRWSGSLFRLMVNLFCQSYSPINGITCKTKYNVYTKKYYLEMFVAKSSIQKVEMMHISQLYVLSINIDGITRTIRWKNRKHIWWETLQHITKHQTCLQHLLWHQAFFTYRTKIKITKNTKYVFFLLKQCLEGCFSEIWF